MLSIEWDACLVTDSAEVAIDLIRGDDTPCSMIIEEKTFRILFVVLHIHYILQAEVLKKTDPANIALIVYLDNGKKNSFIEFIFFAIAYILGYFVSPPLIMVGCLFAMSFWIIKDQFV